MLWMKLDWQCNQHMCTDKVQMHQSILVHRLKFILFLNKTAVIFAHYFWSELPLLSASILGG